VAAQAAADDVYLVNGRRLSGRVVDSNGHRIVIEVGPGRITLPASQVERVVSGVSAFERFEERAAKLAASDAEGWLSLGIWARDQGLATQARVAFERVLVADPGNPIANAGVGRVSLEGRWVTEDERYRAQGYVRHAGRWVTLQERELELRERIAETEARRAQAEAEARVREAEARARAAEAEARAAERGLGTGPYSPGILGPVIGGSVLVPAGIPYGGGRRRGFFPDGRQQPPPPPPGAPAPVRREAKRTSIH
jgi:hypothetical protein